MVLLSDLSQVNRSGPAPIGVLSLRVNGSSFGFLARGDLYVERWKNVENRWINVLEWK